MAERSEGKEGRKNSPWDTPAPNQGSLARIRDTWELYAQSREGGNPGKENCSHSPNIDHTKTQVVESENQPDSSFSCIKVTDIKDIIHKGWGPCSPVMACSRSRSSSSLAQTTLLLPKKSGPKEESEVVGLSFSNLDLSRSRYLSPSSQTRHCAEKNSNDKETDGPGSMALDRTLVDSWNQTMSDRHLPNSDYNRWRDGCSAPTSRDGNFKAGQKCRPSRDSSHSPRRYLDRSLGLSPIRICNAKEERKKSSLESLQSNDYHLNEKTVSDMWDLASPHADHSISMSPSQRPQVAQELTMGANLLGNSRTRSVSPWSQAAHAIDKYCYNEDTDGWGKDLDQTGPDAWHQSRSNLSPNWGLARKRGGWGPRDRSLPVAPKRRRTGSELERTGGRDGCFYPKRSPGSVPGMENGRDNAATVSSWEGPKHHDWSVYAVRNPVPSSHPTNMLQRNPHSAWDPSAAPFKYQTLEQKISNLVPSSVGPPEMPMSDAPKMSNGVDGSGAGARADEVDDAELKWALAAFAKPKLRPFWLKKLLTEDLYRHILKNFVNNVARSLKADGPQTHEDSSKFIKQQDHSLRKYLEAYLRRFLSEEVIMNMRDENSRERLPILL